MLGARSGYTRRRALAVVFGLIAISVSAVTGSYLMLFARFPVSTVSPRGNQSYVLEFELFPYAIALLLSFAAAVSANPPIRKIGIRISAVVAAWALITSANRVTAVNPYGTDMWFVGVWLECALNTAVILVGSLAVYFSSDRKTDT
jgi:hypothetical protein